MRRYNILIISHGHPDFNIGGAEKVAYLMYKGFNELKDYVNGAYFLFPSFKYANGRIELYKEKEYFWHVNMSDYLFFRSNQRYSIDTFFVPFLKTINPDIIHINHYIHIGLEIIPVIKRTLLNSKIILTLHEYLPICYHNGQMVKRYDFSLCFKSSPEECNVCFPEVSKELFFLRKHRIMSIFEDVDIFVAPSNFLKSRFVEWGISQDKIKVIENGFPKFTKLPPRKLKMGEGRNRFAFFGQINIYKGLHIVLEGLTSLPPSKLKKIKLYINGPKIENLSPQIKKLIEKPLEHLSKTGVISWIGTYRTIEEQKYRMLNTDWVIVPSIWWENSPLVIQEAFGMGRPVICSNIGGMAEKVKDGITGIHVPVGDPIAWAEKLIELADIENIPLWDNLYNNLPSPPYYLDVAKKYLDLIS